MLANLVHLCYISENLIIDFNFNFYGSLINADATDTTATSVSILDESIIKVSRADYLYTGR